MHHHHEPTNHHHGVEFIIVCAAVEPSVQWQGFVGNPWDLKSGATGGYVWRLGQVLVEGPGAASVFACKRRSTSGGGAATGSRDPFGSAAPPNPGPHWCLPDGGLVWAEWSKIWRQRVQKRSQKAVKKNSVASMAFHTLDGLMMYHWVSQWTAVQAVRSRLRTVCSNKRAWSCWQQQFSSKSSGHAFHAKAMVVMVENDS